MTAKGYCISTDISTFLGLTFTAGQTTYAAALIEIVEQEIDLETGRAWLTGVQTDEAHYDPVSDLYLRYTPVSAVATVKARAGLGETEETLTVDEDYEVRDLTAGLIRLVYPNLYDRIRVTYTPVATVPGPIKQACIEWCAAVMQACLRPDTYGLDSFSLPDLSMNFSRAHVQAAMPPTVRETLDLYRYPVGG